MPRQATSRGVLGAKSPRLAAFSLAAVLSGTPAPCGLAMLAFRAPEARRRHLAEH